MLTVIILHHRWVTDFSYFETHKWAQACPTCQSLFSVLEEHQYWFFICGPCSMLVVFATCVLWNRCFLNLLAFCLLSVVCWTLSFTIPKYLGVQSCLCDQCYYICAAGEYGTNALVHSHPDCLPCSSVDCQVQSSVPCPSLHTHPYYPSTHVYDWSSLHWPGNEMCKYFKECVDSREGFFGMLVFVLSPSFSVCVLAGCWRCQSDIRGGAGAGCILWISDAIVAFSLDSFLQNFILR